MQKGTGKTSVAARVNGATIPYGRYKLAFENSREFYKKIFPEQMSDEMLFQVRASALHQVINETLLEQMAGDLGIRVTVKEIYDVISKNPNFQNEGAFDPNAYKNVFLPRFERRYGLNYENLLKHGLLADKAKNFLINSVNVTEAEAKATFDKKNTLWSFERIIIPESIPETKEGTSDVEGEIIAKQVLEALQTSSKNDLNNLVKTYKLKKENLSDISLEKRHRVIPTEEENGLAFDVFSLSKENPTLRAPVKSGTSWYVFKLLNIKRASEENWKSKKEEFLKSLLERKKQDYLMQWQETMKQKADIEEYVLSERG
jgi:hypothetical protein